MAERIEKYQEDGDFMNETEAIRSLLRAGLDAEDRRDRATPDGFLEALAQDKVFFPAMLFGLVGLLLPFPGVLLAQQGDVLMATAAVVLGLVLMIGGILVSLLSLLAQAALASPLGEPAPSMEVSNIE